MNLRNTEQINPQARYTFAQVERQFGLSTETLRRWRQSKRLVPISTHKTLVTGQRLLEAIENRSLP